MPLIIIGSIFLICGGILFYKAKIIKIKTNEIQEQYKIDLQQTIKELEEEKNILTKAQIKQRQEIEKDLKDWQTARQQEIELYLENEKKLANQNIENAQASAKQEIIKINDEVQNTINCAEKEKTKIQKEIDKLKSSLSAGVQARLREQSLVDKINFYKLSISPEDLSDVKMLNNLKSSLHNPVILSKLIWTQYFQKQTTELCDRVLGKRTISGIYKITNLETEQCYIGQSVNISERFKQHCKCGLGIDASSTNKLYQAMQNYGIWNFSFEILEECPKELLNEKEAFWIEMYQSNQFGYNSTKGNKT